MSFSYYIYVQDLSMYSDGLGVRVADLYPGGPGSNPHYSSFFWKPGQ